MPYIVRNIKLGLDEPEEEIREQVAHRLRVSSEAIRSYAIVQRSLDARKKDLHFSYQVEVTLDEPIKNQRSRLKQYHKNNVSWIETEEPVQPRQGTHPLEHRPVIIGFGPAGMFAALRLALNGYRPIVYERGQDVRQRHKDIMQTFYKERKFSESSNLLYGEGGAGTYSDGKLYTRVNDPLCRVVLETLYQHGADPDILIDSRPHIGSDRLPTICIQIRKRIESLGGEIRFGQCMDDLRVNDGALSAVHFNSHGDHSDEGWVTIHRDPLILGIGHSARDTIRLLHRHGVRLVPKPFQIGVRIEHPQEMVNQWQYGSAACHQKLSPAEYHLVAKGAAGSYGDVYSFCMCPGGIILPTNESEGLIATNGASRARRSNPFGNSGLVITIDPATLFTDKKVNKTPDDEAAIALQAMDFQRQWEQKAFELTGGTYRVPIQRANDFLHSRKSEGSLETSYPLGGQWSDIRLVVPTVVSDALQKALPMLEEKFPGFAGENGMITAPETRASAPLRILRDKTTRQAVATTNLYPVGEGAGYAGGIISAAIDGIKTADTIMAHYAPPR